MADQNSEKETERRRDEAIARALRTPPKPLKDVQRKNDKNAARASHGAKKKQSE